MYGGLFGDLPAAKGGGGNGSGNNSTNGGPSSSSTTTTSQQQEQSQGESVDADKKTGIIKTSSGGDDHDEEIRNEERTSSDTGQQQQQQLEQGRKRPLPVQADDRLRRPANVSSTVSTSSVSSSLLRAIGTAGTSMAFVPSAAIKKIRKQQTSNRHGTNGGKGIKQVEAPVPVDHPTNVVPVTVSSRTADQSMLATSAAASTTTTTTIIEPIKPPSDEIVSTKLASVPTTEELSGDKDRGGYDNSNAEAGSEVQEREDDNEEDDDEEEEEEITDPYDPYIPNDLLQYWEHQAAKLERLELERQAKESIETQRLIRERLEKERRDLMSLTTGGKIYPHSTVSNGGDGGNFIKTDDTTNRYDDTVGGGGRIVQSNGTAFPDTTGFDISDDVGGTGFGIGFGRGAGRGRGRGVSNLPAWLVEKQRKEAEEKAAAAAEANQDGVE